MGKYKKINQELLEYGDIKHLISQCKDGKEVALVVFLWIFGCRVTEAVTIKIDDIYFDEEIFSVKIPILKRRRSAVKQSHTLTVKRNTPFLMHLIEFIDKNDAETYLFTGNDDGHMRRQIAWRIINRLQDGLYPHFFRHNRLNKLAETGASAKELQNWAGWSSLSPSGYYLGRRPITAREIT